MYTHIHNRHTCVGVYQSSQRNRDVLAEQTRDCLCSEVAVSSFERFKDFFFSAAEMILEEDKHQS